MKSILLIDNYDSFTFNVAHLIKDVSEVQLEVVKNDKFTITEVQKYDGIILSPGPGIPAEAGLMPAVVEAYKFKKPIFGICLGHQCLGEAFGGTLKNLSQVFHGQKSPVNITASAQLFSGIPPHIQVGRYHSWVVDKDNFPTHELNITATDSGGEVMAFEHKSAPIFGVQFHPESIMTEFGSVIMKNFLSL